MKNCFTVIAALLITGTMVKSQNLPQMFHFSDDSLRLIRGGIASTGLYDETNIDTMYLYFDQSNYWQMLVNNYSSQTNIPATMVFRGETYDSAGVRFRGQTSYQFIQYSQKKSFNITLDWVIEDQGIEGYETLNLNNGYEDRSFLREVIYENCSRNHIPSVRANHVQLYINDQNWGIYVNVQQLDRQHVKEWFVDKDATRWRAEKTGGGPGFGAGYSSLNWHGWDTSAYKNYYKLKKAYKENPWQDLVEVCYVLNNTPSALLMDSLANYLDVDGTLWFLAHEILFTDDDSYVNKGGMDYFLYYDVGTNRMIPIEYDANSSMSIQKATQWSPFYRETNSQYPLMNKLMAVPEIRQRYLAHVRTIMNEAFNLDQINGVIDEYAARIQQNVQDDPKKLYSYNEFLQEIPKLKQFFSTRRNYILNNTEVNREAPSINNVVYSSEGLPFEPPNSAQAVDVTAVVTATQGIFSVSLYFGNGFMGHFTKTEMFDDGNHNDGDAGDGIYGAQIPPQQPNTSVRFYIEALSGDNWNTAAYEPAGAVNDVYYYKVVPVHLTNSQVVINELMSDNVSAVQDPNGDYDDWVEFYNKSGENIDLSGYYLSDKEDQLTLWQFPDNTEINAGGYLIVWCDDEAGQPGLHAGFALSKNGESLFFTTPDLEIADEVTFGDSDPDMAFARVPNGTGNFVWQEHTFNGPNNVAFSSPVIINELMALNTASVQDPNGEYDDWVELYNTSGDTVDISGYHFSDDPEELSKWQFPAGTAINGYSYLIVWCDGDNGQPGIHASFTLNDESGSLFLTSPNLEAVDEVLYNDVSADLGFARMPNGTGEFIWQVHTFSQHNGPFVNCQVVLNELMPDNVSAVTDPDGEYDDWLELFNNAEEAFDLSGFFLSDKNDELDRWAFPEGTIIGGNDYLIVWCDDDLTQTGLHAGFSLSKNGEQVFFTSPYIQILDSTSFGPAFPDTAFARMPNGTGSFVWQAHTIGANNDPSIMVPEVSSLNPEFIFFPNPATDHLTLLPKTAEKTVVTVYSLLGDIVFQKVIDQKTQLHTGNWPRGIYVIGAGKGMMKKLILQ